jgi:hypothetical protein
MQGMLYSKDGKVYNTNYCEIYVPSEYLSDKFATNRGSSIETIGLLYIQEFKDGIPQGIKLLNIPAIMTIHIYESSDGEISVHGQHIPVLVSKYIKDSFMFFAHITQGREVAELFLKYVMNGRLPKTLDYAKLADMWWKNLNLAAVSFKVPSKIYESIIATIYRNPNNIKQRFGEYYGKSISISGYKYQTGNIRDIVENLSTFSGLVYEDINRMITSGINNSLEGREEPVSPLEKIMKY